MKDDLQLAKETLITQNLSLALAKDERILGTSRREGIIDLLTFVDELGEELRGGALADKIVDVNFSFGHL
ncbi:MAG: hypothetical protein ACETWB_07950, partial [Anaerolineae bacterium]